MHELIPHIHNAKNKGRWWFSSVIALAGGLLSGIFYFLFLKWKRREYH